MIDREGRAAVAGGQAWQQPRIGAIDATPRVEDGGFGIDDLRIVLKRDLDGVIRGEWLRQGRSGPDECDRRQSYRRKDRTAHPPHVHPPWNTPTGRSPRRHR